MYLEDEQYELLGKFVEAHLGTPRERRGVFTAILPRGQWQATFFHSGDQSLNFQGNKSDAEILANAGLLLKSTGSEDSDTFSVLPQGIEAYRRRQSLSSPLAATSAEPHREFDIFISHASEDKELVARPLYKALVAKGWKVWFDEVELELGDSLRRKIDEGLSKCRYGVVILSPSFFQKEWPRRELDGLVARETASGKKAILPIWHNIDHGGVAKHSPTLADRYAAQVSEGIEVVAAKIISVFERENSTGAPIQEGSLEAESDLLHQLDTLKKQVEPVISDELERLSSAFRASVPNAVAQLGATGNRYSTALIHKLEGLGIAELERRSDVLVNTWRRALSRLGSNARPDLLKAVADSSIGQLSTQHQSIESIVNAVDMRRVPRDFDFLESAFTRCASRMRAELEVLF